MSSKKQSYDAIDMIVWSGTGNTRRIAERIAEAARSKGAVARVLTSVNAADESSASRRLVGLLAPTHGFTAPWPLIKAALTVPDVRGTDVFILVTRGGTKIAGRLMAGFEGTAVYLPAAILALRGAHVRGGGAVDMPLNWTVIVPSFNAEDVEKIVARGDAQADEFSSRLLDGDTVYRGLWQLALGIVILPLSIGYMLIARLLLGKTFFADERCTSCGTCAKNCPHSAIQLRGKVQRPYWTFNCQNCMRCMSNCPTDAIEGGQGWLLFYVWLLSLPFAALATSAFLDQVGISSAPASGVIGLLFSYAWIVISVWFAYGILWLGLFVPGLRFVLTRATFTRFYRRYRGPEGRK